MTTLVCFSYAGSAATTVYRSWQAGLAPEHDVVAVDYPGRGRRRAERAASSTRALVDDVLEVVARQVPPGGRWALFGHSMGAMVAHQVAARAQDDPRLGAPQVVFVSGRRPPGDQPLRPPGVGSIDDLLRDAASWGGVPPDIAARPHLARPLLGALADDLRLSHDPPGPAPVLTSPLHVLWSDGDPLTSADRIGRWALASRATVTFHRFTGDHFFVGAGAEGAIPLVRGVLDALDGARTAPEDAVQQPRELLLQVP